MTDAVWGLENTSPKVIDEDPEVTQAPVAASRPNHGDTLDFKGMPDLEDRSSKGTMGEEPSVNTPLAGGLPALPWVCFKSQIHQDEIQYWVVMFIDTCTSVGRRARNGEMMPDASTATPLRFPERWRGRERERYVWCRDTVQ